VARRFNNAFTPRVPRPDAKLTEIPKVPGTDGRKMSKSYGNAIYLSDRGGDHPEGQAHGEPTRRASRSDRGNPDVCPVFDLHKIFTPAASARVRDGMRTAGIGCWTARMYAPHLVPRLDGIRERARSSRAPDVIVDVLRGRSAPERWRRRRWRRSRSG